MLPRSIYDKWYAPFNRWYAHVALFILFFALTIGGVASLIAISIPALLTFTAVLIGISWITISLTIASFSVTLKDEVVTPGTHTRNLTPDERSAGEYEFGKIFNPKAKPPSLSEKTAKYFLYAYTAISVLLLILGIGIAGFMIISTPASLAFIAASIGISWMSAPLQIGIIAFLTILAMIVANIAFLGLLFKFPNAVLSLTTWLPAALLLSCLLLPIIAITWLPIAILTKVIQLMIYTASGCLGKYGPLLIAPIISLVIGLMVAISILSFGIAPTILAFLPAIIGAIAGTSLIGQLLTLTACFSFFLLLPNLIIASINSSIISEKGENMKTIYNTNINPVIRGIIGIDDCPVTPIGQSFHPILNLPLDDVTDGINALKRLTDEISEAKFF